jgi:ABC-2 type transport system permease protein
MQLVLFGYAINFDPKHLPTAVSISDPGRFSNSIVAALRTSEYFSIEHATNSPSVARRMLEDGTVNFVVEIPANFSRAISSRARGPRSLCKADASDPASASNAVGALQQLVTAALRDDLKGPLAAVPRTRRPSASSSTRSTIPKASTQ